MRGYMENFKIKSRTELVSIDFNIYNWLLKNNKKMLNKYLPSNRKGWTKEECIKDAKKYKNKYQ